MLPLWRLRAREPTFGHSPAMKAEGLDQPWKIENVSRSIAVLPARAAGLSREDAILVLELLAEARKQCEGQPR